MQMLTLGEVVIVDVCTIAICVVVALRTATTLLHPATMMIGCHVYVVSVRLYQLLCGVQPMGYDFLWRVGESELLRAALASDLALLAMSCAWILMRIHTRAHPVSKINPKVLLSRHRVIIFAVAATLLAAIGSMIAGPNGTAGAATDPSLSNSGYIGATTGWFGWTGCLLIYLYGFRPRLVILTAILLAISMLLNSYRGVIILPLLFLIWTWLARRKSTAIPWSLLPLVLGVWLIWLPMKPFAHSLQSGDSVSEALGKGLQVAFTDIGTEKGSAIDFQFLDMIGSTMTLVDLHESYFYGTSVLPILVSPVPRGLWPEKPEVNAYQFELDVPGRPIAKWSMTAGLVGESYADFGWAGVVLVPFLVSLLFSWTCLRLQNTTLYSPGCLLYLIYLTTFMQLYRDGLISAIWFPFVHAAPVGLLAVSHWLWHPREHREMASAQRPELPIRWSYQPSTAKSEAL